ncbi:MAG: hypothetical protein BroJett014_04430 [Planctomycetota bacterium]|nr:MAG: hypothetical protein BroJett014_04430 [Planctomycetota bacterium]
MVSRWLCHDSLLAKGVPEAAFDVVIGNPPWEKLKITRHEFLRANGSPRHYGADYPTIDQGLFSEKHDCMAKYGAELLLRYPMLGSGEPDLYRAFIELFLKLARPEGCVSVLVPAGLIRSEGTQDLRAFLFDNAGDLSFTVLENRARFFAIDTRFKFLGLLFTKTDVERRRRTIRIAHSRGTEHGVERIGSALLDRKTLQATRPDLTVPEVKSQEEWRLFNTMYANGESSILPGSIWQNEIVREVDMTRDAKNFQRDRKAGLLPLIEGRMVHQHRFGAKTYKSGTGRQAKWEIVPLGTKKIEPQFWYPQNALPPAVRQRVDSLRAGFCDITGQTNERTMLAALVPPGVVCGNKVPTVRFINDTREERLYLWLAVVNSFSFDWALRRIVTTTVNYFLLNSMPLPKLSLDSAVGRTVVAASRELSLIDSAVNAIDIWKVAHLRASIDVGVHAAYGLDFKDLELMFQDFPLLDRAQPPLRGEQRSTVTRDFVLSHASEYFNLQHNAFADRLSAASAVGAVPYVPSEFAAAGIELPVEASHG